MQVPVVVTDKAGNHVAGLSRTDFEVLENGKTQKIASFEAIEASHAPLASVSVPGKGEFSNLGGNAEAPRTVTIIALDTINTPFLDQAYGRKQLVKFLAETVDSGQILSLVSIGSRGTKVIHGLTSDPAELIQALKKVNGELPGLQGVDIDTQAAAALGTDLPGTANSGFSPGSTEVNLEDFVINGDATIARMQQDRAIEATMRAFLDIAWSVSGIPGKKAVLWATAGFPFFLDGPAAVPGGYLSVLYERTMQALNDAEISVYPVDVRGLVNFSPSADASRSGGAKGGSAFAQSLAARSWLQTSTLDALKDFAAMTGGRAFYNTNDLAASFRRAAEDSSSYYLLGYYLDTKNTKPGWRQLKVKVHQPGTEVRARSGFLVTNATVNPELSLKTDIGFALTSPFDSTGIPLTVRWRGMTSDGGKKKVQFGLHVAPEGVTLEGTRNQLNMEIAVVAVTQKSGAQADSFGQTIKAEPSQETVAKLKAEGLAYNNNLELPPGQYTVRFVVRDNLTGKLGSVSAPLTVD